MSFGKGFPLRRRLAARKKERDEEIKKIITGESDKLLVVVGPCSADNEEAVVDYVSRLVKVQEKTKDRLVIVPRVYTNKPRTTGEGYMGMIHQPDPGKEAGYAGGHSWPSAVSTPAPWRKPALPARTRCSIPKTYRYLSDILGYVAVGARSVENQLHRLVASGMRCARGPEKPHRRRPERDAQLCCGGPSAP